MTNSPSKLTSTATKTVSDALTIVPTREVINIATIPATSLTMKDPPDFKKVTFKDVILTEESSNMVSSNNKRLTTRLKSVLGIPTVDISNLQVKVIAKNLGIKGCGASKKVEVCPQIVEWVSANELVVISSPETPSNKTPSTINRRRYEFLCFDAKSVLVRKFVTIDDAFRLAKKRKVKAEKRLDEVDN